MAIILIFILTKIYILSDKEFSYFYMKKNLYLCHTGVWHIFEIGQIQCKYNFIKKYVLLLIIGKFETNQIFLYFPGGYMMHLKPPVMCYMSNVLCLVSHAISCLERQRQQAVDSLADMELVTDVQIISM